MKNNFSLHRNFMIIFFSLIVILPIVAQESRWGFLNSLNTVTPEPAALRDYVCSIRAKKHTGSKLETKWVGSGFVYVDRNGNNYIITNRHVAEGAHTFSTAFEKQDGTRTIYDNLEILKIDDGHDLAILYFADGQQPFSNGLTFYKDRYKEGDEVISAGFPGLNGPTWQYGVGNISNSTTVPFAGGKAIQHTAAQSGGNSGGPLLMKTGKFPTGYSVVGVNTASWIKSANAHLAIPIDVVEGFINKAIYFEPNDTMEAAIFIDLETVIDTTFNKNGDVDWYKFTIPSGGGQITIYTDGNIDTFITLYDNRDRILGEFDDNDFDYNAGFTRDLPEGIFYIKVEELNEGTGSYSLFSEFVSNNTKDIYEDNDSMDDARLIGLNSKIHAYMTRTFGFSGVDYYRVVVPPVSGHLTIYTTGDTDTFIELKDVNNNMIARDDDSGENYNARLNIECVPTFDGEAFYIRITGSRGRGHYTLYVYFVPYLIF
jgi:S1-C subfamily serine protease